MGEHWWMLVGVAVWTPMLIAMFRQPKGADGCPKCGHDTGLDDSHCAEVEDASGWCSDPCRCQHDYHWNHDSRVPR